MIRRAVDLTCDGAQRQMSLRLEGQDKLGWIHPLLPETVGSRPVRPTSRILLLSGLEEGAGQQVQGDFIRLKRAHGCVYKTLAQL